MATTDDYVVTGEAVVLETRPTSVVMRMLGALVDVAVTVVVGLVGLLVVGAVTSDAYLPAAVVVLLVVLLVGIPTGVETLSRGRSLGKLVTGTRVVRDDGGAVGLRHAFARALVGVAEIWTTWGFLAFVTSLVNAHGKRLGDLVAGTQVVRVRGVRGVEPLPVPDPRLAAWARAADVARLPDGLALAARQFLGRAAGLDPASRARLGQELAGRVERYVAPGPPWGTPPEAFLVAVLAERRDRDLAVAAWRLERRRATEESSGRLPHGIPDPRR